MFGKKKNQDKKLKEPEYLVRMRAELNDLCMKLDKLAAFEESDDFKKLNAYQRDLMVAQYGAMLAYRNVLNIRISYEQKTFVAKVANAAIPQVQKGK